MQTWGRPRNVVRRRSRPPLIGASGGRSSIRLRQKGQSQHAEGRRRAALRNTTPPYGRRRCESASTTSFNGYATICPRAFVRGGTNRHLSNIDIIQAPKFASIRVVWSAVPPRPVATPVNLHTPAPVNCTIAASASQ